jgi:superfamily II DNA or RNA helicase
MGLAIISQRKQPALIIVHRKQLFDQWIDRIQSLLGIAEPFIGKIVQGQIKTGTHITVAMIQSIGTNDVNHSLFKSFGTIIVDECHHVPAKTFREVIKNFNAYYLYGLTATPIRKNNDEKLIFIHIGDVIHEVKLLNEGRPAPKKLSVIVRETNLTVPFDHKTDSLETLSKILIHDSGRNGLIVEDIKTEANSGRKVLVLTERKAHIDVIHQYLKSRFEVITISGEDSESSRKIKLRQIAEGHLQILISTGQFLGEGADIDSLDCLMLAYPFAFEGKLIQYIGRIQHIGRIQRGELVPVIYDYRDIYIDYLEKMFRQRNRYYQKLVNARQLQKFDELVLSFNEDKVSLNLGEVTLPISTLDLPDGVEKFKEDIAWKLRVLNYNDETGELMTEITNYHAQQTMNFEGQISLQFLAINKISFAVLIQAGC